MLLLAKHFPRFLSFVGGSKLQGIQELMNCVLETYASHYWNPDAAAGAGWVPTWAAGTHKNRLLCSSLGTEG